MKGIQQKGQQIDEEDLEDVVNCFDLQGKCIRQTLKLAQVQKARREHNEQYAKERHEKGPPVKV